MIGKETLGQEAQGHRTHERLENTMHLLRLLHNHFRQQGEASG